MIPPLSARAGHEAAVRRLTGLTREMAELQQQISSGRRVNLPGDDPIAFSRAATLKRLDTAGEAQRKAMDTATARLSASEVALGSLAEIAARAKELALAGRNDTLNAADRAVLATEVQELLSAARGIAETRGPDGEALFAGGAPPPAYEDDAEGLAAWAGLGAPPQVAVTGRLLPAGISGPEAFGVTEALPPPDPLAPPPDPGAVPPPRQRNLFDSLAHLAATLTDANPARFDAGMEAALAAIDDHVGRLAAGQALLGTRSARLDAEAQRLDSNQLQWRKDVSRLEDTDLVEAIARLDRLSTVLEAAQASFARVSSLSLWDQLR